MDFAPYQDTAPESVRALSPPPNRTLSPNRNGAKSPSPNRPLADPFGTSSLPAPSHFNDEPRRRNAGFGGGDIEAGRLDVNLFETSLPLRLDYEAMLAYLLLPPAGPFVLLVVEHKSDYVRYVNISRYLRPFVEDRRLLWLSRALPPCVKEERQSVGLPSRYLIDYGTCYYACVFLSTENGSSRVSRKQMHFERSRGLPSISSCFCVCFWAAIESAPSCFGSRSRLSSCSIGSWQSDCPGGLPGCCVWLSVCFQAALSPFPLPALVCFYEALRCSIGLVSTSLYPNQWAQGLPGSFNRPSGLHDSPQWLLPAFGIVVCHSMLQDKVVYVEVALCRTVPFPH